MRFALALDVSLDEFLHPRAKKVSTKMPNRRVLRRVERIDSLSLHQQNHLLKTIDGFLKRCGRRSLTFFLWLPLCRIPSPHVPDEKGAFH